MKIEYRNYCPGDENQLADLFNLCFHQAGVGFLRTPRGLKYRYVDRPHFDPKEIQIAEDKSTKKIVGAVYSTLEEFFWEEKQYLSGSINDVAVHPSYGRLGIAKKLMIQALDFMKEKNCDFSTLAADPQGHARSKMYIPLGWTDFITVRVWFTLNIHIFRYLPLLSSIFVPLIPIHFGSLIKGKREKAILKKQKIKGFIIHPDTNSLINGNLSHTFHNLYNSICKKQRNGKNHLSTEEWTYFRERSIRSGLKPTLIVIYKKGKMIGGASILRQWMYFEKFGFKLPLAIIREWGIDHAFSTNPIEIQQTYEYLVGLIKQAAWERKCVAPLFGITTQFPYFSSILRKKQFLSMPGGVLMINKLKQRIQFFSKRDKPVNMDIGEMFLYP